MSEEPIFSFIIPVYKKPPDVFRRCLKDLFDASLKEIEVICVFDGDDPALTAILPEFPEVKPVMIAHGGAPEARNVGLDLARGKYVCFWDADCYVKPDGPKRWIQEFEAVPNADFVYFDYEFVGEQGGFSAEPFDAYSLTCGNYISSMSPIKREKAGRWDETLEAAQDWDYWLSRVEEGCKGVYIEGSGFSTDTIRTGLSSSAWTGGRREETIRIVREKHGIAGREIGIFSDNYRGRALKLAEILGADLIKPTGQNIDAYKMILIFGYGFASRFEDIPDSVVKIQYWVPGEIAALAHARYKSVMETIRVSGGVHNFCNTLYEKNKLAGFGIRAEILPLPASEHDFSKLSQKLPDEFSALVINDEPYGKLLQDISVDLPHIKFSFGQGKAKDHSCLLSFFSFAALDDPILTAHLNGRNVISNVQEPFCGFIDPDQNWDDFKRDLYEKLREIKNKPFNAEARDFYVKRANPGEFKKYIQGLMAPKLEAANV